MKWNDIKYILSENNITNLYHANSLITSKIFFDERMIMARSHSERLGHSWQISDEMDKKYGIWSFIFFDFADLHEKFGTNNNYGPITLKFDLDFIPDNAEVFITKNNPTNWNHTTENFEDYCYNFDDIKKHIETIEDFSPNAGIMVMVNLETIDFDNKNIDIIIENLEQGISDYSIEEIYKQFSQYTPNISIRECDDRYCTCISDAKEFIDSYPKSKARLYEFKK